MRKVTALLLALLSAASLSMRTASAWSRHDLITKAALEHVPAIASASVTVEDFSRLLKKLGYANAAEFNKSIQIRKDYLFSFHAKEVAGNNVPLLKVLSVYSDEPDWGMEQNLFEADQYPELWKDEYRFMGGKQSNLASQAFRHMYWGPFSFFHPLNSTKLPFGKLFSGMGLAPKRAAIFIDLSQKAKAAAEEYWSARFLANALHYIEDVSQPFHSSQTPSKKFVLMPFTEEEGLGLSDFSNQVAHIVKYYHLAFEDYVAQTMQDEEQHPDIRRVGSFTETLGGVGSTADPALDYSDADVPTLVRHMSAMAMARAGRTGRACLGFFPKIRKTYKDLNVEGMMSNAWWADTNQRGAADSEAKREYFKVVREVFGKLGYSIRQVVLKETASGFHDLGGD